MAISVTLLGTACNKDAGIATIDVTGQVSAGDIVIACVASDSNCLVYQSQSGGGSTLMTLVEEAINSGNVIARIWWCTWISSAYVTVKISFSADGAAAISAYKVTGLSASPVDKKATGTGSSTTPSTAATAALTQADELVIGAVATEGPNGDTAGSWTTGAGYVSGNEQRLGTTGAGAASNVTISSAAEVVSATTAQTAAKTGITDRDWAAVIATFKGETGTQYPQSVSGGITPSGAIVLQGQPKRTGAITPAGVLTKFTSMSKTGAITPAGGLIKQIQKAFTGGLTLAGVVTGIKIVMLAITGGLTLAGGLIRQAGKNLIASITPDGSLAKQAGKNTTGAVTPSGVLSTWRQAYAALTGALTMAGELAREARKGLVGAVTSGGVLVGKALKVFTGNITPDGAFVKSTSKQLSGSVSIGGVLTTVKTFLLSLAGELTSAGSLAKQTAKAFVGSVTSAGGLIRQVGKVLTGGLTSAGELSSVKTFLKMIEGALTLAGDLGRQTGKVLTGTLSSAGGLFREAWKILTGELIPSGAESNTYIPAGAGPVLTAVQVGNVIRLDWTDAP